MGRYQKPVSSLEALEVKPGLYAREYEKGKVFVNIGPKTQVISFEKPVYVVVPEGGGPVPKDGRTPGSLIYQKRTRIKIAPWQGVIILYQPQ